MRNFRDQRGSSRTEHVAYLGLGISRSSERTPPLQSLLKLTAFRDKQLWFFLRPHATYPASQGSSVVNGVLLFFCIHGG